MLPSFRRVLNLEYHYFVVDQADEVQTLQLIITDFFQTTGKSNLQPRCVWPNGSGPLSPMS